MAEPQHVELIATGAGGGAAALLLFSKLWKTLAGDRSDVSKAQAERDIIEMLRYEVVRLSELNDKLVIQVQELRDELNDLKAARHVNTRSTGTDQ